MNCKNSLLSLNFLRMRLISIWTVMFGFTFIVQNGTEPQNLLVLMISHVRKLFHVFHVGSKYMRAAAGFVCERC
jgi:hypothetical protein